MEGSHSFLPVFLRYPTKKAWDTSTKRVRDNIALTVPMSLRPQSKVAKQHREIERRSRKPEKPSGHSEMNATALFFQPMLGLLSV
jgi:hypothetical protein